MVRVKELARVLNGVDGNFWVNTVNNIEVDYVRKSVTLKVKPIEEEYNGSLTVPLKFDTNEKFDLGDHIKKTNERFFPNINGNWTEQNEKRFIAWKNGEKDYASLDMTEEEAKKIENNKDNGSNTIKP